MGQIKKAILNEYNEANKDWNAIYPQTSGDMVIGQVSDSNMLDGKTSDKFMPSTFEEFLEVTDTSNKMQGVACKKLVITSNKNDETKVASECLWVKGKGYISNGQEIATRSYVDEQCTQTYSNALHSKVDASIEADRLSNARKINDVAFDGTKDIIISVLLKQSNMPAATKENIEKLWINTTDGTMHYYFDGKWNPIIGEWSDYDE